MFNDDEINKLINPVSDRQEKINNFVIGIIATRVKEIGTMLPSDLYSLKMIQRTGEDIKKINDELARISNQQVQDIQKIIKTVAADSYQDMKPFYDYKEQSFVSFEENTELQKVVNSIAKQTSDTYTNLSKAQAFMLRDISNPKVLVPTPLSDAYQSVVDEAIQASQSGVINYQTAMRRTLKQLNDSGIRQVVYQAESYKFHSQRLDTAVRRNVLDGIRAVNQGVQDETGKQFGSDGKEITVHANPAPDHAHVQGHQLSNEEFDKMQSGQSFQDVNGQHFEGFPRAIGTLNCRHFVYSIILGVTNPNYTNEQLQNIIDRNNKGYTDSKGRHYTMYQCTQVQRRIETEIRHAKDGYLMADKAGDSLLKGDYKAKISDKLKFYTTFSRACGLSTQLDRTYVEGYD